MSNKLINVIKALYGFTKGSLSHLRDIKSDSIAYYKGDEEISKLIKQLNNQRSDYKNLLKKQKQKYPYLDSAIIAGLTLPEMIQGGVSNDVQLAYELSFPEKSSFISFTDAWDSFDSPEERAGFVSAIKGKLFEIKYVDHLNNTLEPGYSAAIASNPTQPGWDIEISGPNQELIEQIQLKATSSVEYIKSHFEKYPDVDLVTLEDLKGQIGLSDKVTVTAITNNDLQNEIIGATSTSGEYVPIVIALSYLVFSSYTKADLSWFEKNVEFGKKGTGMAINGAIIIQTGFWGLIPILMKETMLNEGNQKRKYIEVLKKQINSEKKSVNLWEKKFSRRDFLKGLALTASMAKFSSKKL